MFEDFAKNLVKMVAEEKIMLSDDPHHIVRKAGLIEVLRRNSYSEAEISALFRHGLVLPIDKVGNEDLYHAGICLNFLSFQKKLAMMGLSSEFQHKIAEMYYPLYWALITDADYEVNKFRKEKGRGPNKMELASLRVLNEAASAVIMGEMEERIIALDAGDFKELQHLIDEVVQRRRTLKRKASYGYQENEVKKLIEEVWQPPLRFYQEREIKAFINKNSIALNGSEENLFWKGHFDFALCDESDYLQLVVEYHGTGHYGNTEQEREKASINDNAKKSICVKAGIPLVVLTVEFALLDGYKEVFRKFLRIFKERRKDIELKSLCDMAAEPLNKIDAAHIPALLGKVRRSGRDNVFQVLQRLEMYEIQKRVDLLLALLWEVYGTFGDAAKLGSVLNTLERVTRS